MTHDQRELLELAAYAIGLRGKQLADGTIAYSEFGRFNSLTNKADAFDLLVKLGLHYQVKELLLDTNCGIKRKVFIRHHFQVAESEAYIIGTPYELDNMTAEAATMLAITRAAAAIGKQMKERQNAK